MIRPSDSLKPLSHRTAELLVDRDGMELFEKALLALGVNTDPVDIRAQPESSNIEGAPKRIGAWIRKTVNGEVRYVYDGEREPARMWSGLESFAHRKTKGTRVLLFGESVARGFFFDPNFTPAGALEMLLREAIVEPDIEVIDLARTDLMLDALSNLAADAMTLEPDAVVLFAGNNWHHPFNGWSVAELSNAAALLRSTGDWASVSRLVEEGLRERIRAFFSHTAGLLKPRNVQAVVIVPEFNLIDWRNEGSCYVPLIGAEELEAWNRLRAEADNAFAAGDLGAAASLADRLRKLDGGMNPYGAEILGRCALAEARCSEARFWFETARDAAGSCPLTRSPRTYGFVQDCIREESMRHGLSLVDLPKLFQQSQSMPDRLLFMDYCHLTAEGITTAMRAASSALLSLLGYGSAEQSRLESAEISVSPEHNAEAHVLAAVHNAYWGQEDEIVRHHLKAALDGWPEVRVHMEAVLQSHVQRVPVCVSEGFARLHDAGASAPVKFFLRRTSEDKPFNPVLVRNMSDLLGEAPDFAGAFGDGSRKVSLLSRAYCSSSLAELESTWSDRLAWYAAYRKESRFRFFSGEGFAGRLHITCRSGYGLDEEQPLNILINGELVASMPLTGKWSSRTLELHRDSLSVGENALVFSWPRPAASRAMIISKVADHLEAGRVPNPLLIFGAVYQLVYEPVPVSPPVGIPAAEDAHEVERGSADW